MKIKNNQQIESKQITIFLNNSNKEQHITVNNNDSIIFAFSTKGVSFRADGDVLVLLCPDGYMIYLHGALLNGFNSIVLDDGHRLLNIADFLNYFSMSEIPAADFGETLLAEEDAPQVKLVADGGEKEPLVTESNDAEHAGPPEHEGGSSNEADVIMSSGLGEFRDYSGSFVSALDRLDGLSTHGWERETSLNYFHQPRPVRLAVRSGNTGAPGEPDVLPEPPFPLEPPSPPEPPQPDVPTISLAVVDGDDYPLARTVMESDPYGMVLSMELSEASATDTSVVMNISGTAAMGTQGAPNTGDYGYWGDWELHLPDGTIIPSGSFIHELAPGQLEITIPAGATHFAIHVPLVSNDMSENDRSFIYDVVNSGKYQIFSGQTDTVWIIDDSRLQDIIPGWTPPVPGVPLPPGYVGPVGPIAGVVIIPDMADPTLKVDNISVLENDGAGVNYRLELLDILSGGDYSPTENIKITLKITGHHGLEINGPGCDFDYDFSVLQAMDASLPIADQTFAYDQTTGTLTFTIPAGWDLTNNTLDFIITPRPDALVENGVGGSPENLSITVVEAVGNECVRGSGVTTDIIDIPTISVSADQSAVFESAGHAGMSNEVNFTFTLSSGVPQVGGITVELSWAMLDGLDPNDFVFMLPGDSTFRPAGSVLPGSIFLAVGETSYSIKVKSVDDRFTETLEKLKVTIDPQGGVANAANDYHVSAVAGKDSATVEFVDDTASAAWNTGQYLDGPIVQVVAVDAGGNIILDEYGRPEVDRGILEKSGAVNHMIVLLDRESKTLFTAEQDITVKFNISGLNGATIDFNGSKPAGWDFSFGNLSSLPGFQDLGNGNFQLTIPTGSTGVKLEGEVHNDTVPGEEGEGFSIIVTETHNNESSPGDPLTTVIMNTPVASISRFQEYYSESDSGGLSFVVRLGVSTEVDVWVRVQLGAPSDTATFGTDYYRTGNGFTPDGSDPEVIWVKVAANTTFTKFTLDINDDALTENNETVTAAIVPQTPGGSPSDEYRVIDDPSKESATSTIVDDTKPWPGDGGTVPVGHGTLDGPEVRLLITDEHGVPLSNATRTQVMENGGPVYYKLQLLDKGTNTPYSGADHQDITVNISALGQNGALLDGALKDFSFANGAGATGGSNWVYNPATGKITVTIPSGRSDVIFTGTPVGDIRTEAVNNGNGTWTQEKVDLTLDSVSGNEAAVDNSYKSVSTEVVDVPTASVGVNISSIFESDQANTLGAGDTRMGNEATYTFNLSSPSLEPVVLELDWLTGSSASSNDYTVKVNGVAQAGLPGTITIPAGSISVTVTVTAVDDRLTESDETIKVTIKPEGGTATAGDSYHVSPGASDSATVTIKDDSTPAAGVTPHNEYLDGPMAMLVYCDQNGNILLDGANKPVTSASFMENSSGKIYYKVALFETGGNGQIVLNGDGSYKQFTAEQDISVTIAVNGYSNTILNGAGTDFNFSAVGYTSNGVSGFGGLTWTPNGANQNSGTIGITIGSGTNGTVFDGKTVADMAVEASGEGFSLGISKISGNEAQVQSGNSLNTDIVDVPTISISADAAYYSESGEPGTGPNEMSFTLHLTSPLPHAVTVNLAWSSGAGFASAGTDFQNIITVTIPANTTAWTFTVPIIDDALTEGNETVRVTLLSQSGSASSGVTDNYHLSADGKTASTVIVDDAQPWPAAGGTPPYWHGGTGDTPAHGPLEGPEVRLYITDAAGNPLSNSAAAQVMENGGKIYYTIKLVNSGTDTPYSGTDRQAVTVELKAEGLSGALLNGAGKDFNFDAATGLSYDPASGKIIVTIPNNKTSFTLSGQPVANNNVEAVDNNDGTFTHETIGLGIVNVSGNESAISTSKGSVTTEIIDVPTVSIAAGAKNYSESPDPGGPGTPGATAGNMSFTVSLTSPSLLPVTVQLTWSGTATPGVDYSAYPTSVTIPAGQTSYSFSVPITDDNRSENNETVIVSIKPQTTPANVSNDFHVSAGKGSATTTIVDDSQPWPADDAANAPGWHGTAGAAVPGGVLDGPIIKITAISGNENVTGNQRYDDHVAGGDARYDADDRNAIVLEQLTTQGSITYRVELLNRNDGTTPFNAQEPVTIAFKVDMVGGATYGKISGEHDFYFDLAGMASKYNASYNDVTGMLTLTIPQGEQFVDFTSVIVSDRLTEKNRGEYDAQGNLVNAVPDEGYNISVQSVNGNEASPDPTGGSIHTAIDEDYDGIRVSLFAVTTDNVAEGTNAMFRLSLSTAADEDVIVILKPGGYGSNPANQGNDDFADAVLRIVIPKGQTSVTIPIAVYNDLLSEGTEGFQLSIDKVMGGEAIINEHRQTVTGSIRDDMNGPVISLVQSQSDTIVNESDGTATYTIRFDSPSGYPDNGIPVETVTITLQLFSDSALLEGAAHVSGAKLDVQWNSLDLGLPPGITVDYANSDLANGIIKIKVPAGFGDSSWGTNQFTLVVDIIDDKLSELREKFDVRIVDVKGSEAVVDLNHDRVTTTIVDDSEVTALLPHADKNNVLDGPFVNLKGTTEISESGDPSLGVNGDKAVYTVFLTNPNGDGTPWVAEQDVTVTIKYYSAPGSGYDGAEKFVDFEIITETITIPAGSSSVDFYVRIADDSLSENNERFTVQIDSVTGHEARLPLDESKTTVNTVIVDDTQAWTHGSGQGTEIIGTGGSHALDGPILSLDGTSSVIESVSGNNLANGSTQYTITFSKATTEEVTVTMLLKPNNGLTLDDILGPPVNGVYDYSLLTSNGRNIQNFKAVDQAAFDAFVADPSVGYSAGWTFSFTVPAGYATYGLKLPIYNDNLSEANESFTVSINNVKGSEAVIDPAHTSVTTTISDDNQGAAIGIQAFDPDDAPGGLWQNGATVPNEPMDADNGYFHLKVITPFPCEEDVTVTVVLRDAYGDYIDHGVPLQGNVTRVTVNGISAYRVTLPAGQSEVYISIPKNYSDYSGTDKYDEDYFLAQIYQTFGSESRIDYVNNFASVTMPPPDGYGPMTYVDLENITPNDGSVYDGYYTTNGGAVTPPYTPNVKEGCDATFNLSFSGDNVGGDGKLIYDQTVTILVRNRWYVNLNTDSSEYDIDFSKFGTPPYENLSWDNQKKIITVTIPAGTAVGGGVNFHLPMSSDALQEGTEYYDLTLISSHVDEPTHSAQVDTGSQNMGIIDVFNGPQISLHQVNDEVTEGGLQRYYLELSQPCDSAFSVTLKFFTDPLSSLDPAVQGKDYNPILYPLELSAGNWVQQLAADGVTPVWRYYFDVSIPDDELSENDEHFNVAIDSVSESKIGMGSQLEVTTVIKDDGLSGPLVYLAQTSAVYGEDASEIIIPIILERPAMENVSITLEILLRPGSAELGSDFTLSHIPGYYTSGGRHFIAVTIPKGQVQLNLKLENVLINDTETEADEYFGVKLVEAHGGEVRIMDNSDVHHGSQDKSGMEITIKDALNGPEVNVTVDKTEILESAGSAVPGASTANPDGIATFTFSLSGGAIATQQVKITVRLERVRGALDGVLPSGQEFIEFDVYIPVGSNAVTWSMDTLFNDEIDERDPKDEFKLSIINVVGNEAQAGNSSSASVKVVDDDHAPEANPDKIILMVTPKPVTGVADINVLDNDSDADGDPLVTNAKGLTNGVYGKYYFGADGKFHYELDANNTTIKNLSSGETLVEDSFIYTATDGHNPVNGTVSMDIKVTHNLQGSQAAEWIFGSELADTIYGGGGADIIHGGLGDDVIYDAGDGKGKLYGDAGDDSFVVAPQTGSSEIRPEDFSYIDGGAGMDRITVNGSNLTLNFTSAAWDGTGIKDVEIIDIGGLGNSGYNKILLDAQAVIDLNASMSSGGPVRISGNDGDAFSFPDAAEGWHAVGGPDGDGYVRYENGDASAVVLIYQDLAEIIYGTGGADVIDVSGIIGGTGNYQLHGGGGNDSLIGGSGNDMLLGGDGNDTLDGAGGSNYLDGGSGNDLLVVHDTTGDGKVNSSDFSYIFGGSGTDTLKLENDGRAGGVILDFTSVVRGSISGVEVIDISGDAGSGKGNGIVMSDTAFNYLSGTTDTSAPLRITGNAGDTFELSGTSFGSAGSWSYNGKVTDGGTWYKYTTSEGNVLYVDAALVRHISGTASGEAIVGGAEDSIVIMADAGNDTVYGGSGNETIYGGDGNDVLHGGSGLNILYGGDGNDTLYNDSATDVLYGDAGNDFFIISDRNGDGKISDADFQLISGGTGVDVVQITGSGQTLRLTSDSMSAGRIAGVETFDINGSGNNLVVLDSATLAELSGSLDIQPQLRIKGGGGDGFELPGDWTFNGPVSADGLGWFSYTSQSGDTVYIQDAMRRVYSGTSTNDSFTLDDLSLDGKVSGADFASITGGGGIDTLKPGASGMTIDLSDLQNGQISGIQAIDLTGQANNHVILKDNTLAAMGTDPLLIAGDVGDSFELTGVWTYTGNGGGFHLYADSSSRVLQVSDGMLRVYNGTSGSDTIVLDDLNGDGAVSIADFVYIHGQGGEDTITLGKNNLSLDLTGLTGSGSIQSIERISLNGNGSNSVMLDADTLTHMNLGGPLVINGDAGDSFTLHDAWTYIGPESGTGGDLGKIYQSYMDSSGKLAWVQDTLTRVHEGSGANDTFVLEDTTGDSIVNGDDFGRIAGGLGTDTIKLASDNLTFDLSGLAGGKISGIEVIDLCDRSGSLLVLDGNSMNSMGVSSLRVDGGGNSNFVLSGTWMHTGSSGSYITYQDSSGNTLEVHEDMKRMYKGTSGSDTFILDDVSNDGRIVLGNDFAGINGISGDDTLRISGSDTILELTGLPTSGQKINGVTTVDLTGGGNNRVVLDETTLSGMSVISALTVEGDAGDSFDLRGSWAYQGTSGGYHAYTDVSGKTLRIAQAMKPIMVGDASPATFQVEDLNGDGKISGADFVSITGGSGSDIISLGSATGTDKTLDFTGLASGKISGIGTIALFGFGDNNIRLDTDTLTHMGGNLTVTGNAGDSYTLIGTWTYVHTSGGRHVYSDGNGHSLSVDVALTRRFEGTGGADTLQGDGNTPASIYAGAGDDTLSVVNTGDKLYGEAGDDLFILGDGSANQTLTRDSFGVISGGGDSDALMLDGTGTVLDLRDLAAGQLFSIEKIDITGSGNSLILDESVFAVNTGLESGATLTVTGDPGNKYDLSGSGWQYAGTIGGFLIYTNGSGTLQVQDSMVRVTNAESTGSTLSNVLVTDELVGGVGDDSFLLGDLNGDSIVDGADFGLIAGGGGTDVLALDGNNLLLDLSGLANNKISGLAGIDCNNNGNRLILDDNTLSAMQSPALQIDGGATDSFELMGSGWSYSGGSGGYHHYSDGANTLMVAETLSHIINGSAGDDILHACTPSDILYGNGGADTFVLHTYSSSTTVIPNDFGSIFAGGPGDILMLGDTNLDLDLTGLAAGKISGIEDIDLVSSAGGNTVYLNAESIGNMGIDTLSINGDASDSVHLSGAWSHDGNNFVLDGKTLILDGSMHVTISGNSAETISLTGDWSYNSVDDVYNLNGAPFSALRLDGGMSVEITASMAGYGVAPQSVAGDFNSFVAGHDDSAVPQHGDGLTQPQGEVRGLSLDLTVMPSGGMECFDTSSAGTMRSAESNTCDSYLLSDSDTELQLLIHNLVMQNG